MKDNFSITPMTEKDLACVSQLEREVFGRRAWAKSLFEYELLDPYKYYVVLKQGETISGYGGFAHILDEVHIMNIAVREEDRGRGFGKAILNSLIEKAKNLDARCLTLEVSVDNKRAISLYKKAGFVSYGIRPNYYGEGEDAEIFWFYLK